MSRPPQSVVLSRGSDGSLIRVEVPAEAAAQQPTDVPHDAAEAWRELATREVEAVALELRCRERLAKDLEAVEADLAAGRRLSVPPELLGMTPLDERRCLLPHPNGDRLRFELHEWKSNALMKQWLAESHKEGRKEDHDKDQQRLRHFFACAEACHARAVRTVEIEELRRFRPYLDSDLELEMELEDELDKAVTAQGDLEDQQRLFELGGW